MIDDSPNLAIFLHELAHRWSHRDGFNQKVIGRLYFKCSNGVFVISRYIEGSGKPVCANLLDFSAVADSHCGSRSFVTASNMPAWMGSGKRRQEWRLQRGKCAASFPAIATRHRVSNEIRCIIGSAWSLRSVRYGQRKAQQAQNFIHCTGCRTSDEGRRRLPLCHHAPQYSYI